MDWNNMNICYGCMRRLASGRTVCPICGRDNARHSNPEDTLPEGSVLNGKYLVGRVLGRGGFGVTYLGFDLNLQIRVAVKEYFPSGASYRAMGTYDVISLANAENISAFARGCNVFMDEAQTLARFNSPYIVHVREFFRQHGSAYIIMDYVDGVTLTAEILKSGGKMPVERVLTLMKPLIQQLGKLHEKNIIHRDIKPDNIMIVTEETGEEHLVLLDFGAARSFISEKVTKTYTTIVTPSFAPLEQYSEKSRQGPYTDVYALCATMYYLLTGQVPTAVSDQINGVPIKSFREYNVVIPARVEKAIMHGLVLKSENRTQTMYQLSEELLKDNKPAHPPKKKSKKPGVALVGLLAAILVVAAAIIIVPTIRTGPESQYRKAISLMEKSQYQEAEQLLEELREYKESPELLAEVRYNIGRSYETGGNKDEKRAKSYYQLAADGGNADAMNRLGEFSYNGIGGTKNYKTAFGLFEQAADAGNADAYYNLGLCYENGYGTDKNIITANSYYMLAADAGNRKALEKIKE